MYRAKFIILYRYKLKFDSLIPTYNFKHGHLMLVHSMNE